jgi:hypothetical protein
MTQTRFTSEVLRAHCWLAEPKIVDEKMLQYDVILQLQRISADVLLLRAVRSDKGRQRRSLKQVGTLVRSSTAVLLRPYARYGSNSSYQAEPLKRDIELKKWFGLMIKNYSITNGARTAAQLRSS